MVVVIVSLSVSISLADIVHKKVFGSRTFHLNDRSGFSMNKQAQKSVYMKARHANWAWIRLDFDKPTLGELCR